MIEEGDVVHEVVVPAPPDDVFDMFVDGEKLVTWIGIAADVEARPGGRFRFEVVPGQFCEGRYVTVERPRLVVFTWGWTDPSFGLPPGSSTVEVTFEPSTPDGAGTRLRLVHRGLGGGDHGRLLHDDGWARFLARLTATAAGEPTDGYPAETPDERLAELRSADRPRDH